MVCHLGSAFEKNGMHVHLCCPRGECAREHLHQVQVCHRALADLYLVKMFTCTLATQMILVDVLMLQMPSCNCSQFELWICMLHLTRQGKLVSLY
jgi:hypothetical protein